MIRLSCTCARAPGLLAALALTTAVTAGDPCADPASGCCDQANGTPGCFSPSDPECCALVCDTFDVFCCEAEWDSLCAAEANSICSLDPAKDGCGNAACTPDAGDCCSANGTPGCDDPECCNTICDCDPFCCDSSWDAICAGTGLDGVCGAAVLCKECLVDFSCGEAGTGDCCSANGTPACDDLACCEAVCAADAFCCDTSWDGICAGAAIKLCPKLCAPTKCDLAETPGNTPEPEPCGDDTNGGCNAVPPVFGAIACGETVRGTSWATGGMRDTDWFLLPAAAEAGTVTADINSELPTVAFVVDGIIGCAPVVIGAVGSANGCSPIAAASATVAAGLEVVVFVSAGNPDGTGIFEGFPCDSGLNDYEVAVTCGDPGEGPENDDCADALPIGDGDTAFSNVGATTDGPPLDPICDKGFGVDLGADIWYAYTPTCDGTLTVSTCDQATFDTRLAAYTGDCAGLVFAACNDDGPGCGGFTSILEVPVTCGVDVLLRVGGFGEPGDSGTGTLSVSCAGTPCGGACPTDLDGDGSTGVLDLVALIGAWGPNPGHPADFDGNGSVGVLDLIALIGAWGPCP